MRLSWLLVALGLLVVAALSCAYLSLCLLFLQGQWQILYHPGRTVSATPTSRGLAYTPVHFAPDDAGKPQLTGWWLPVDLDAPNAPNSQNSPTTPTAPNTPSPPNSPNTPNPSCTVLYLHDAAGSLSNTLPALTRLHALGCAVLAIDYRGFGDSAPAQPSQASMLEDARHSITYLEDTRHLAPGHIILWGQGIGATVAAEAALPPTAALGGLVIEDVNEPAHTLLSRDPRTRWLPVTLLLRDRLDPQAALHAEPLPKLFLASSSGASGITAALATTSAPPSHLLLHGSLHAISDWIAALPMTTTTANDGK